MCYAKAQINHLSKWRESYNPLRGLTMQRAVTLLEEYQRGQMANIQWLFAHIESMDATLMTVIENIDAAVSEIDWDIRRVNPDVRGYDEQLAADQEACLRATYHRIENLQEAISHLVLARYRGFSHLAPWCRLEGRLDTLYKLNPINQWNMVRKGFSGPWAYNPSGDPITYEQTRPEYRLLNEDIIVRERQRFVNRIALIKYLRATTAEKDWDAYVEIYGIPAAFIILPGNVPTDKKQEWLEQAMSATEGGAGVLPGGSDVKTLSENRATQPFQPRLEWLEKQLVIAATGGMLTVLAESGTGTLAGNAHKATFDTLAEAEARRCADILHGWLDVRVLNRAFPGKPHLCAFDLSRPEEKDVGEAVSQICALRSAGIDVATSQIEEMTGYQIAQVRDLQLGMSNEQLAMNATPARGLHTACTTAAKPISQTSRKDRLTTLWLQLRREGYAPIAKRVYELLAADPTQRADLAQALLDDIPALGKTLLKDCPVGEALAEELKRTYLKEREDAVNASFAKPGECRAKEPSTCRVHGTPARAQIGKQGNWQSLGLKAGRDIPGDKPMPNITYAEAIAKMKAGDTVTNPLGDTLAIDEKTYKHLNKKGRPQKELTNRLREYPQMKEAITNPHEIWEDENGNRKYVQFLEVNGRKVINAVDEDKNHVLSWHSNATSYDHYREGTLLYVRYDD